MQIDVALLAEYAVAHADGTTYITGGFLQRLAPNQLPTLHPQLAVVVRGHFTEDECGTSQRLSLRIFWASEVDVSHRLTVEFNPMSTGAGSPFQCIFAVRDLLLPAEGTYDFVVTHEDKPVARLPLHIATGEPTVLSDARQVFASPLPLSAVAAGAQAVLQGARHLRITTRLRAGFEAFATGDLNQAIAIFRAVIAEEPTLAAAHNNLGFVLLGSGRSSEAREALLEAQRLGYSETDVLNVNLGCAAYLGGDPASALEAFASCFRQNRLPGNAVLWLITADALQPATVQSVAAYVALVAINAAWATRRLSLDPSSWLATAERLLDSLPGDHISAPRLRESLDGLRQAP